MRRSTALFALGALSSPAAAAWLKSHQESSWEPPRQTGAYGPEAGEQHQIAMGWSPVPTDAPKLAGAMDLNFALGKRSLGADTCAFNVIGTCIPYTLSVESCKSLTDAHTVCCDRNAPSCLTLAGKTNGDDYTLFVCDTTSGSSPLLFSDPLAFSSTTTGDDSSITENPSSTTDDGSSTTTSAAATSTSADNGGGGSSTNVGAIAGGVVGGVAALALVGLAGFLLFRRRSKTTPAAAAAAATPGDGTQNQPPMAQGPQSPGPSFVPSSPSNAAYPSGVPSNYQSGYQQAYDPSFAAPYGQPQGYQQPGYSGYSPQPQNFQGQYPQQTQYPSQYGVGGYGAPSTSPPPHFTPSPGPNKDGPEGAPQQHAQELPAVQPLGNEGNRAELS
ncbi:uncharacterized protein FSUBG_11223 [Fusarium subglutinans]|uniref:Uncharacterized protein n=1 Tax=Gibberella subglutinans TaxID=42677 RepID=A0A8H5LCL9_GIBSU|nr:uncharacterized protein FSUBG_11223 [Fusarium subglutinans]KAF5589198.1 hypothetical protein FSUBG_11223 [Fusarium subglutinans]